MKKSVLKCKSFIVVLFLLFNFMTTHDSASMIDNFEQSTKSRLSYSLESISPDLIKITNDQNFTDYGFLGSGILSDPYLIENYILDSNYQNWEGIWIEDTTKHFTIRNCTIRTFGYCIFIRDVADNTVNIINNTLLSDFKIRSINLALLGLSSTTSIFAAI